MPLTNAEKQAAFRQRRKARAEGMEAQLRLMRDTLDSSPLSDKLRGMIDQALEAK